MNVFLNELFSIAGKVIIVTGASRGIGMTIANSLAKAGAKVIGLSRSENPSNNLSVNVDYKQCDITDRKKFNKVCKSVSDKEGTIDVLINSAGVSLTTSTQSDSRENFNHILDVNLKAAYECCMTVSEYMKSSHFPSIINITSINSVVGFPGNPGYVAAKGGLRMLTKALAIDLIKDNIRVNAIAPGYIHTDMTEKSYNDTKMNKQRLRHMIIPRWGEPEDIVGAVIFLISGSASYITGQDIVVDGGWTAKGLST